MSVKLEGLAHVCGALGVGNRPVEAMLRPLWPWRWRSQERPVTPYSKHYWRNTASGGVDPGNKKARKVTLPRKRRKLKVAAPRKSRQRNLMAGEEEEAAEGEEGEEGEGRGRRRSGSDGR